MVKLHKSSRIVLGCQAGMGLSGLASVSTDERLEARAEHLDDRVGWGVGQPAEPEQVSVFCVHNGKIVSYRDYLTPLVLAEARVGLPTS